MHPDDTLFFEGTEKKVELALDPSLPSLRSKGRGFWDRVSESAGAQILSGISNAHCDAYLLSESSLFVFDHKLLMITCGRTRLPRAVMQILESVPPNGVRFFAYERKNEVFPHAQASSFFDDVRDLGEHFSGRAFKFGHEDDHHLYLYHLDRPFEGDDETVEMLMYGIDPGLSELFRPGQEVRRQTRLDELLPGFEVDDHLFRPSGYSLNAIREDQYWTLHVTPNEFSSYVSFETNSPFDDSLAAACRRLLELFRPRTFDLVRFDQGRNGGFEVEGYCLKTRVEEDLDCGYRVRFLSYYRPQHGIERPLELPVAGKRRD